ncbi:MAG: leucine-rich repeat protein [Lachnospiraceae bacterium]|nr:leucine-rich repeat protein [Lachnospiraceae bacterium]
MKRKIYLSLILSSSLLFSAVPAIYASDAESFYEETEIDTAADNTPYDTEEEGEEADEAADIERESDYDLPAEGEKDTEADDSGSTDRDTGSASSQEEPAEDEYEQDDAEDDITAEGDINGLISWKLSTDGVLTISGKGEIPDDYFENKSPAPWYKYRNEIKSLVIEEGVTKIGAYCFYKCEGLTHVELPDGLLIVGSDAFDGCISLESIEIPESVTEIVSYAFRDCENLKEILLHEGLQTIDYEAFCNCTALTELEIPDSVTTIRSYAFEGCFNLQKIKLSKNLQAIQEKTFYECSSLKSVVVQETVKKIAADAFYQCRNLKNIFYTGDETAWKKIRGNDVLSKKAIHYNSMDHTTVTDEAKIATCTENGLTEGSHCEVCGEIFVKQKVIQAPGHTWSEWEVTKEASYAETGMRVRSCSVCEEKETEELAKLELPFRDVSANSPFTAAIVWAKESGITGGFNKEGTMFGTDQSCTRGQIVTFLWRAAGEPDPSSTENPFTDVSSSSPFFKAILWARENHITGGISENTFGVNRSCTRGQAAAFIYRYAREPEIDKGATFRDVPETIFCYRAVSWAVENGITSGMSSTSFAPDSACTRGQIVTFLYRYMNQNN